MVVACPPRMPPHASDAAPKPRRPYAPRLPPGQRREQLIDAALSVIVSQGYEGVSIEAIARTAGVTRPVIYDHFQNLGRLLQALIERSGIPADLDVELAARTIRCLSEEAGRMLLTDPAQYSPERYERFSRAVM